MAALLTTLVKSARALPTGPTSSVTACRRAGGRDRGEGGRPCPLSSYVAHRCGTKDLFNAGGGDELPVATDRAIGPHLGVGEARYSLNLLAALLHPRSQAVKSHYLFERGSTHPPEFCRKGIRLERVSDAGRSILKVATALGLL